MRQRKNFLACTPQKLTDPESPQCPRLGLSEPVTGKQHTGSGSSPTDDPGDLRVFTSLCISGLPSPYTLFHHPLVPTALPFNRPQVSNQNFEIIRITLLFFSSRCLKRINPCPYCTGSKECRLIPGSCQALQTTSTSVHFIQGMSLPGTLCSPLSWEGQRSPPQGPSPLNSESPLWLSLYCNYLCPYMIFPPRLKFSGEESLSIQTWQFYNP